MTTVNRRILFLRIHAGNDAESNLPVTFDPGPALQYVAGLSFDTGERYMLVEADDALTCFVDSSSATRQRVRLAVARRRAWPLMESAGHVSEIPSKEGDGLLEQTHLVFFPENIVGAEFNFYGPRASRIAQYLREKIPLPTGIQRPSSIDQLVRGTALTRLDGWSGIHLFDLSIRASQIEQLRLADASLAAAFDAAETVGKADELQVVLRSKARSKTPLSARLLDAAKALLPQLGAEAKRFTVRGTNAETGVLETVNLVKDALVDRSTVKLKSAQSRAVDSGSMYEAIETAYTRLKDEIDVAAAFRVRPA